ncbi:uncharacterized protein LOC144129309 isoform X1 [Amblyomma americanum]
MEAPQFPSLQPRIAEQPWFYVDRPWDDEVELTQLEKEHQNMLTSIAQKHSDLVPIGKTAAEVSKQPLRFFTCLQDEDEEDDEDDDNEDDESDSNEDEDDELDADDINYDQDSPMFH